MKKIARLLALTAILSGCSGDKGGDYIGLWEEDGNDYHRVVKVSREGENLVVTDGLRVTAEGLNTSNAEPFVLTRQGGQWMGPMGMAIAVSDDGKKLLFAGDSYSKADDDRIEAIKQEAIKKKAEYDRKVAEAEVESKRQLAEMEAEQKRRKDEREQKAALIAEAKPACDALMNEYRNKRKEVERTYRKVAQSDTRKQRVGALKDEYREKQKSIYGCSRYL